MRYGFFNSDITGYDEQGNPIFDRAEDAEFFAKFYKSFFGNGVFPNPSTNLQVIEHVDMMVKVLPGIAFVEGHFAYEENERALTFQASHSSLDRIDRVVLRLDYARRLIDLYVVTGVPSASPIPKPIVRPVDGGGDIYELSLAEVFIAKGTTSISQQRITDTRMNKDVCGVVINTLESIDPTTLFIQLQDQVNRNIELIQSALDKTTAGLLQSQIDNRLIKKELTVNFLSNAWVVSASGKSFTQRVDVMGMKESYNPFPILMNSEVEETKIKEIENMFIKVIDTFDGYVIATCTEKPAIDLLFKLIIDHKVI